MNRKGLIDAASALEDLAAGNVPAAAQVAAGAAALEKIDRHIEDALAKGATVLARAEVPAGQYATPTVVTGATTEMVLASEETFGPVAPLFSFESR